MTSRQFKEMISYKINQAFKQYSVFYLDQVSIFLQQKRLNDQCDLILSA